MDDEFRGSLGLLEMRKQTHPKVVCDTSDSLATPALLPSVSLRYSD